MKRAPCSSRSFCIYKLTAEKSGFKVHSADLELRVNDSLDLTVRLEVGSVIDERANTALVHNFVADVTRLTAFQNPAGVVMFASA